MMRLALLLALLTSGCAYLPPVIPTGNPLTDMLVNVAVEEAARAVVTDKLPDITALLTPRPECVRGRRGLTYCGNW